MSGSDALPESDPISAATIFIRGRPQKRFDDVPQFVIQSNRSLRCSWIRETGVLFWGEERTVLVLVEEVNGLVD